MTRLERLKREASAAATWRGHSLHRWHSNTTTSAYAECDCGASVAVNCYPAPNGIDICGDAVALNHPVGIIQG